MGRHPGEAKPAVGRTGLARMWVRASREQVPAAERGHALISLLRSLASRDLCSERDLGIAVAASNGTRLPKAAHSRLAVAIVWLVLTLSEFYLSVVGVYADSFDFCAAVEMEVANRAAQFLGTIVFFNLLVVSFRVLL